ncbi:unnamed protein product [Zymoseptoria tritici ST99CH_1A5]|uniref:Uncharacterized protein n=1 Tax=Zymoseptoria tritici ST99CH_1A5 TaxID=1276529 RepID=A0A1Y6LX09_ZYMTR|nr:unnamed protein product [Zymoseptoria tritici ST99CH_1A5]
MENNTASRKRRRALPRTDVPEQPQPKTAKKEKAPLTSNASKQAAQLLRSLDRTDRHFWKATIEGQLSQQATDHSRRSQKRALSKHEISTLALNEVAAKRRRGMFLYLPSRDAWKPMADETLIPACRNPPLPGSQYPSIVFADCVWNGASTSDFYQNSHRARFLKANAMFSTLPKSTPLFAIQYVHHPDFQLFMTPQDSLVVFATSDAFFVTTTHSIAPKQGRIRGGVEPNKRLEIPRLLWREGDTDGNLEQLRSLEELYDHITSRTTLAAAGRLEPTFAVETLTTLIPRPSEPSWDTTAVSLGTPFVGDTEVRTELPRRRMAKKSVVKDNGDDGGLAEQ